MILSKVKARRDPRVLVMATLLILALGVFAFSSSTPSAGASGCQWKARAPHKGWGPYKGYAVGTAWFEGCRGYNVQVVVWPLDVDKEVWLGAYNPVFCKDQIRGVSSSLSFELLAKCNRCQSKKGYRTVAIIASPKWHLGAQKRKYSAKKKFRC